MTLSAQQITEYLISGYIREFESSAKDVTIPVDINIVCIRFYGFFIEIKSQILTDTLHTSFIELLNNKFDIKTLKQIQLLYNSKQDGNTYKIYASKCLNKGKTITIIKTNENDIFGGYTSISWGDYPQHNEDPSAFLFVLEPKNVFHIFDIKETSLAVYHYADTFGPWFGRNDVVIWMTDFNDENDMDGISCEVNIQNSYGHKDSNLSHYIPPIEYFNVEFEIFQLS